jgi:ATP-binding cassette subfamily B protein
VQGLEYVYPDSRRQVLRDVNLELGESDKVLLTGGSGSGKSTFGALLAGRLQPSAGTVLSQGIDRYLVGAKGWLNQVCYVPQPGGNHVLTDTFAFNLLLGRCWPPTAADLKEAQAVAERLGLGPLIEKMPAGMMQMVGEGGWRLSQGEQARLFLARGILQGAKLLVVDELLAPLDPETSLEVLEAIEALPSQLLLIAHT